MVRVRWKSSGGSLPTIPANAPLVMTSIASSPSSSSTRSPRLVGNIIILLALAGVVVLHLVLALATETANASTLLAETSAKTTHYRNNFQHPHSMVMDATERQYDDWNWFRYSNSENSKNRPKRESNRRVLVAQTALTPHYDLQSFNVSLRLVDTTARINHAYARTWNCDYLQIRSTQIQYPQIVQTALAQNYDWLLLLQAQHMIADLDRPFERILPSFLTQSYMLAFSHSSLDDSINEPTNSLLVWNLKHPQTRRCLRAWNYKRRWQQRHAKSNKNHSAAAIRPTTTTNDLDEQMSTLNLVLSQLWPSFSRRSQQVMSLSLQGWMVENNVTTHPDALQLQALLQDTQEHVEHLCQRHRPVCKGL